MDRFASLLAQSGSAAEDVAGLITRLFDELPFVGIGVSSPTTKRWVLVNRTLCEMFGYSHEEMLARSWLEITHPDDRHLGEEEWPRLARNEIDVVAFDKRYVHRDGHVIYGSVNVKAVRRADGTAEFFVATISDITEREQHRLAILESERTSRFLFEHAPEGILVLDVDSGMYVEANVSAERLFGRSRDDLLRLGPINASPPTQPDGRDSTVAGAEVIEAALRGESTVFEWTHRNAAGEDFRCEVRLVLLPVAGRRLLRGSITDITARIREQERQQRLQVAIDSSINGIAIANTTGVITYVNRALLSMWGYQDSTQMLGRSVREFWSSTDEAIRVGNALRSVGQWTGELLALRADGARRTMQVNASIFADADGTAAGMLAAFMDVSDTKQLQQQLAQSQKMESIGRLAGGVAHDFNNLLTVMKANLEFAMAEIAGDSEALKDLTEVMRAADSAANLTQQLLAYSRKQIITPRDLDLNDVVQRVHGMLQRVLGEDIALLAITAPSLRLVHLDAGQAEQILMNLAVNARDAMPNGGQLTIETENVVLDSEYARSRPGTTPGDYVMLAVSDTGVGMSAETRAHAFEPFFTTKESGSGTGLGLAMIHGAVMQNGGRVELYSELGQGTTFRIYLPSVDGESPQALQERRRAAPRGTETVMVVEDDRTVRALIVRLLSQQGYRVIPFGSGASALEWLSTSAEPVPMLLTDVIMPGMNGKALAEQVVDLRPDIRVLYVSGYTANVIVHHGVLKPGVNFLAKPFSATDLAVKIREVLDRE